MADSSREENLQAANESSSENSSPNDGRPPVLIEVKTAQEAMEPPADVVEFCRETFQKTAEYLRGELEGTLEDYKLLEKMNKITITKYSEMRHIAMSLEMALEDLNEKYRNLQPYLDQIDQIEESVTALEQAAYNLDHYSKRLESKFKALEKR